MLVILFATAKLFGLHQRLPDHRLFRSALESSALTAARCLLLLTPCMSPSTLSPLVVGGSLSDVSVNTQGMKEAYQLYTRILKEELAGQ